jgi:4-azaleucine resistance transporter AzlC
MENQFRNGFIANLPIGLSVFAYGSVLGMLCIQKGISLQELILMNFFIFAGSAQFVIVDMWSSTLDVLGIILAALLINLRYFLIGASLNPLFVNSSKKEKFQYMHLVADENWAVTMNKMKQQKITPLFLFGGGVSLLLTWSMGTTLGYYLGGFISNPSIYGLDFAFVAIFFSLALNMYEGKHYLLPWVITIIVAIISEHYFSGKWYIIIGAIVGSLCAVYFHKGETDVH